MISFFLNGILTVGRAVSFVVILGVFVALASAVRAFDGALTIDNCADGDVRRYPVALLRGSAPGVESGTVVVENLSSARPTRISLAPVRGGRFKALVELTPGLNRLTIAVDAARIDFSLVYRKSRNLRVVRLIYFVDSTGDASFETPDFWRDGASGKGFGSASSSDFRRKFRTAALLWQTATAERLNDGGFGRRTFALEFDANDDVLVRVQRGKRTAAEYCALSEEELFREIYREIESGPNADEFAKYFVLVAFARRDLASGTTRGRLALGGGALAALDASTLFAWPDSLGEVVDVFSDAGPIPDEFAVDSAFRRTRWALSASTVGAGLHELGHAFGLDHSSAPNDAMSRGFDRFNRIFTVVEPPCATSETPTFFSDETAATWERASAERLIRSRWIEE